MSEFSKGESVSNGERLTGDAVRSWAAFNACLVWRPGRALGCVRLASLTARNDRAKERRAQNLNSLFHTHGFVELRTAANMGVLLGLGN